MPPTQNLNEVYPYYTSNMYQTFGSYEDHHQWNSTDLPGNVTLPPPPPTGHLPFHPHMYTQPSYDVSRSSFGDYSSTPHAFSHYHHGFTSPSYANQSATAPSPFDMSWVAHGVSAQPQQQHMHLASVQPSMTSMNTGPISNKAPTVYDDYASVGVGIGDVLAQQMSTMDLGHENRYYKYDQGTYDSATQATGLSSEEQQTYSSNPTHMNAVARSSSPPTGLKSYACVVSSDKINRNNSNKPSSTTNSNQSIRSTDYMSTHQQSNPSSIEPFHSYSQQQSSGVHRTPHTGSSNFRTNSNQKSSHYHNNNTTWDSSERTRNTNNRRQNYSSARTNNNVAKSDSDATGHMNQESVESLKRAHPYNPKDFNLNPKGARFFVIKSVSN
jgi:hypothetical protein